VIDGIEVAARVSIGVAFTDQGDVTADSLLRNADVAMYSAKARGKGRSATFVPEMHTAVVERHSLGADLAHAVRRGELTLHYQPIVELATGVTVGFESLVRWNHPRRGLLDPGRFIALAEETGAIAELGSWTVEAACRQFGEWQEADLGQGFVAVNLSGHNLTSPAIDRQIAASLAATGLSPSLLTVELTETVLVHDAEVAAQRLRAIRELGVKVAIDDFGTGYSSLNYLHQLPVDILKIARDFVDRITTDEGAATLTTAMIALAGALGLEVIAEGIEHPEQLRRLREMGCQLGQGFWYARPMPASLVPRWISEHEASRPAAIALDHGAPAPSPGAGLVRRDGLARASH
jgi:EAL domain-containing protein (putative c-di-GMP-specific phosphodiesterase class I)